MKAVIAAALLLLLGCRIGFAQTLDLGQAMAQAQTIKAALQADLDTLNAWVSVGPPANVILICLLPSLAWGQVQCIGDGSEVPPIPVCRD